jgi:hypothetical protein
MPFYSVEDQYCNLETGNWHETVFFGDDCGVTKPWWQWWDAKKPMDLIFTTDGCIAGLRLLSCKSGPCESDNHESSDGIPHTFSSVFDEQKEE